MRTWYHPLYRPLAGYGRGHGVTPSIHAPLLTIHRPRVDHICGAMMSVYYKEGVKVAPNALAEIIMASGQDIRWVNMSCHVMVM